MLYKVTNDIQKRFVNYLRIFQTTSVYPPSQCFPNVISMCVQNLERNLGRTKCTKMQ